MIWFYLVMIVRSFVRWFVPPSPSAIAKIDANKRCPVCGHVNGRIIAVEAYIKDTPTISCMHECKDCGARFMEAPVTKFDWKSVMPSKESKFDDSMMRRAVNARGITVEKARQETY